MVLLFRDTEHMQRVHFFIVTVAKWTLPIAFSTAKTHIHSLLNLVCIKSINLQNNLISEIV